MTGFVQTPSESLKMARFQRPLESSQNTGSGVTESLHVRLGFWIFKGRLKVAATDHSVMSQW